MPRRQQRVNPAAHHRAPPSRRPSARAMPASCSANRPGAWVAVSEGQVVGVAESVRRESFGGLSMLFVHPEFQSRGVGGRLLEAAVGYAAGAARRMIQSSPDPRAMRRYFLAGLAMHPTAEMGGQPDRRAIPTLLDEMGNEADLELVAEVEVQLGRSLAEDVAFALPVGWCVAALTWWPAAQGEGGCFGIRTDWSCWGRLTSRQPPSSCGGSSPAPRDTSLSTGSPLPSSGRSRYSIRRVARRRYAGVCSSTAWPSRFPGSLRAGISRP